MMITMFKLSVFYILCVNNVFLWDNHTISTLKLLQIVHRHGDRTVTKIYPNDPFKDLSKYWFEGLGELTTNGKSRMYWVGEFIKQNYQKYLGSESSPREVYARSSAKSRCLESVSCLLSAVYPPNNQWIWNNETDSELGQLWQPIPIYTVPFELMNEDRLLRTEVLCPKASQEMERLENSELVQNSIQNERPFLDDLSLKIGGQEITTLLEAKSVYDHLWTEYQMGYKWSDFKIWTETYEQQIFEKLLPLTELLWITEWNSTIVQRTRAGPLIEELTNNIKNFLKSNQNSKKLYLYSTHDAMIAVLMHSLQVFNNKIIPLSASLIFELHQTQNTDNYFVKLYYLNETLSENNPHLLRLPNCNYTDNCPIDQFFQLTEELIPKDWDKECETSGSYKLQNCMFIFLIIIMTTKFKTTDN